MIIFTGIAGSGKSVQGQLLAQQLDCKWLSIGAVLREHVSGELKEKMLQGHMLDDQQVINYLEPLLHDAGKSEYILDGFPRSLVQADWLIEQAQEHSWPIRAVIHLTIDREQAKDRLLNRGRPDDYEAAISERFAEYDATIRTIIERMRSENLNVCDVDGFGEIETVNQRIRQALNLS